MKPIERISIVDQVINNLKEYIVEGNIDVGDKMPTEKEICEMYGVGRSTAREAYRMMQAIDMIDVRRGRALISRAFRRNAPTTAMWPTGSASTASG